MVVQQNSIADLIPDDLDFVVLLRIVATQLERDVIERLRRDGYGEPRRAFGRVVQHLLVAPRRVSELAELLGVSQQASSKLLADMARAKLVATEPDPHDGRAKRFRLTARGERLVAATRTARAATIDDLSDALGAQRVARARQLLLDVLEHRDILPDVLARRYRT